MSKHKSDQFIEGGYEIARTAYEAKIRGEVEQEFAAEIQKSTWWRRFFIWGQMKREIEQRLCRVAPPNALY